jgi:hypothetical protein
MAVHGTWRLSVTEMLAEALQRLPVRGYDLPPPILDEVRRMVTKHTEPVPTTEEEWNRRGWRAVPGGHVPMEVSEATSTR